MKDEEDEPLVLSGYALAALQSFQAEEQAEKDRFAALQSRAQSRFADVQKEDIGQDQEEPNIEEFKEDWQLSQFWYSVETASALAQELLSDPGGAALRIGVLCAPSVYPDLKRHKAQDAWLFEIDTRFEVLAGQKFVKYDYNFPLRFPPKLKGTFDRLIIDPPFLSDECETKAAMTARALGKPTARYIICSGAKMRDLCLRLYRAKESRFQVGHRNGRLSNDFMCLLNYTSSNQQDFGFK